MTETLGASPYMTCSLDSSKCNNILWQLPWPCLATAMEGGGRDYQLCNVSVSISTEGDGGREGLEQGVMAQAGGRCIQQAHQDIAR